MSNKTEFIRSVEESVDSGIGYGEMTPDQRRDITGRFVLDHVQRDWQADLNTIPAITEAMKLVAFRAVNGIGGEQMICDTIIDGMTMELEETIKQYFYEAGIDSEDRKAERARDLASGNEL